MDDKAQQFQQVIAKCWADETFKQKLIADPAATLKQEGLDVPEGMSVSAVENTDNVLHLVIPPRPAALSDEELDNVAGGRADLINCGYCYI